MWDRTLWYLKKKKMKQVLIGTQKASLVNTSCFKQGFLTNQNIQVQIVSNPEFLREGSAIFDTFHGDRIVIGAENGEIALIIEKMYQPFNVPVFKTDLRSAEMIKYASNAFLATKISFINEIANLSEKLGANINDVATGMGKDQRIGSRFLNAGIGFGGSCFPKDTSALLKMGKDHSYDLKILQSVSSGK